MLKDFELSLDIRNEIGYFHYANHFGCQCLGLRLGSSVDLLVVFVRLRELLQETARATAGELHVVLNRSHDKLAWSIWSHFG